jgi:hypothetical protein
MYSACNVLEFNVFSVYVYTPISNPSKLAAFQYFMCGLKHFQMLIGNIIQRIVNTLEECEEGNGREPKTFLGQVVNFKLDCFVNCHVPRGILVHTHLEL